MGNHPNAVSVRNRIKGSKIVYDYPRAFGTFIKTDIHVSILTPMVMYLVIPLRYPTRHSLSGV